jgi:hypothetical protein
MSMSTSPARPLPRWIIRLGSVAIVWHLLAVLLVAIAAQSGPWPSPFGIPSPQEPPAFVWQRNTVGRVFNDFAFGYLQPLHLDSTFHFSSNRTDTSAVRFEVHLKYEDGAMKTLRFPEDEANFWVRHRQSLLAQNLGADESVQSNLQNTVSATGEVQILGVWRPAKSETGGKGPQMPPRELVLHLEPVTGIDRMEQQLQGPSRWSQLVAQSYVRYLVRKTGAESAELVRHSRDPIPPVVLIRPPDATLFTDLVADFTER